MPASNGVLPANQEGLLGRRRKLELYKPAAVHQQSRQLFAARTCIRNSYTQRLLPEAPTSASDPIEGQADGRNSTIRLEVFTKLCKNSKVLHVQRLDCFYRAICERSSLNSPLLLMPFVPPTNTSVEALVC